MTSTTSFRLRIALIGAGLAAAAFTLTGCSGFESTATNPITAQSVVVSGNVHGGQQPVSGSHIYLYAAAANATYGAASTSLITLTGPGVQADGNGNDYVTTDANGNFSIAGNYTCPNTSAPVYLLAVGGNPGLQPSTVNNTAITLMAVLGACSSITTSTLANINEVTTVAAVTALQQFMADPVHIGTSNTNLIGLNNAAASVANIVDRATGFGRATNLLGNGAVPLAKINSLADILAPCINSASSTSSACVNLFNLSTPAGGSAPTDVATAMLDIAQNPGIHVNNLYSLIDSNAPFQPTLSGPPNDFTLGVTYTGGGLSAPGDVVIDSLGNVWTANCPNCPTASGPGPGGTDSLIGLGPQGASLSGGNGLTANIHLPQGIAIDEENGIWAVNDASGSSPDQVMRFASNGNGYAGFPVASPNLATPTGIAIDANSNAYVVNSGNSTVVTVPYTGQTAGAIGIGGQCTLVQAQGIAIDPSGNVFIANTGQSAIVKVSPPTCYQAVGGLSQPLGIAIDHSDNLWTVDNGTNNISEINGLTGTPAPGSPFPGGYQLAVLAIAGDGSVWFANCKAGCPGSGSNLPDNVIHLAANGTYITSVNGYQDPHFNGVGVAAIDGSGNLWVSNNAGGSLTELLGVAAPVATPIAAASRYNLLGIRP